MRLGGDILLLRLDERCRGLLEEAVAGLVLVRRWELLGGVVLGGLLLRSGKDPMRVLALGGGTTTTDDRAGRRGREVVDV